MKTRKPVENILLLCLLTPIFIISFSCNNASDSSKQIFVDDTASYRNDVMAGRLAKDSAFNDTSRSPKAETISDHFLQLPYFPVNFSYVVPAIFTRNLHPEVFGMPTTTDRLPMYETYGYVEFSIDGKKLKLETYRNIELKTRPGNELHLFIPFTDLTSGIESYGGGRYMDTKIPAGDTLMLDFNACYNPYCAYNKRYSCPLPPPENHMDVAINAGEMYLKH